MSIRIMSNIWEKSPHTGTKLLMQLAIGDHANDEGVAYPGVRHLAKKCRVEKRRAMQIIEELIASGDLSVPYVGGGRGRKKVFQIAPFYLPDHGKGAIPDGKGAIPDGKGEAHDTESYSESSLSIINQGNLEKPLTKHQGFWLRSLEIILPPTGGSKLKDYLLASEVVSEDGVELRVAVATEHQREFLDDRAKKSLERALVGIADENLKVVFLSKEPA